MIPLQQKLRQLRSWQGLTLEKVAEKAGLPAKQIVAIECEGRRWERDVIEGNPLMLNKIAWAYGVEPLLMRRFLEDEYAWRVSARDGNPRTLPRLAQYIYRPLPLCAHNIFKSAFRVVDLETTGKDPHVGTQICEITVLDQDGVVLLNTLVNPGIHIPDELTANVHGISDEMVKDAPTFKDLASQIYNLLHGQTVVIYNANYDAYLLDRLFIESWMDVPAFDQWCLMEAYKDHIKSERWVKLTEACDREWVEPDGEAHRSLADTLSTWKLLQALALQYREEGAA